MSLASIGFSISFHHVESADEVARRFVDTFLPGVVDPKSVQFTWMSKEESVFYNFPASLPAAPFNPREFASERYLPSSHLSQLSDPGRFLQFDQEQFVSLWHDWVEQYRDRRGEVSFQTWGLVRLDFLSNQRVEHDWFLMEAMDVQGKVVRVPLLEIDVKIGFSGDITMSILTHSLVWTQYSCIVDLSAARVNDNGYVRRKDADAEVAHTNVCALGCAIRRLADSVSCSSWEWYDESEASRPDVASLLRDELQRILERPLTS